MSYRYENLYIMHYGVGHDKGGHSGRYPWGSGKNPYGGVDPTTKKSDLFKLNGRKFNDVASDLIVKKKYGNRTDVSEEDVAKAKKRTQIALATGEAAIAALATGAVGGITMDLLKKANNFDVIAKESEQFTKQYVDTQTKLLGMYHKYDDQGSIGTEKSMAVEEALKNNKRINVHDLHGLNRIKTSDSVSGEISAIDNYHFKLNQEKIEKFKKQVEEDFIKTQKEEAKRQASRINPDYRMDSSGKIHSTKINNPDVWLTKDGKIRWNTADMIKNGNFKAYRDGGSNTGNSTWDSFGSMTVYEPKGLDLNDPEISKRVDWDYIRKKTREDINEYFNNYLKQNK